MPTCFPLRRLLSPLQGGADAFIGRDDYSDDDDDDEDGELAEGSGAEGAGAGPGSSAEDDEPPPHFSRVDRARLGDFPLFAQAREVVAEARFGLQCLEQNNHSCALSAVRHAAYVGCCTAGVCSDAAGGLSLPQVEAGQMLFIPAGWFHEVTSFSTTDGDASGAEPPAKRRRGGGAKGRGAATGGGHLAVNFW